MKKNLKLLIIFGLVVFTSSILSFSAKAAIVNSGLTDQASQISEEGKVIWDKIGTGELGCPDLSKADFEALGYYFTSKMMGDSYATHNIMGRVLGDDGRKEMYITTGERMSDCDLTDGFSTRGAGFGTMMDMMYQQGYGYNSSCRLWGMGKGMMNYGCGYGRWGLGGWVISIIFWIIAVSIIVMIIKKIVMGGRHREALRILETRYAKGDIDKKEFDERRKDLMAGWHWKMRQ